MHITMSCFNVFLDTFNKLHLLKHVCPYMDTLQGKKRDLVTLE